MNYKEVKFLELSQMERIEALNQMADINSIQSFSDAVTGKDFSNLIINEAYSPDKDFYFMLYDDKTLVVRSKRNS